MRIYDGTNDKKTPLTNHTVTVVSASRIICTETDQMTLRKNGREDWSLFYCEKGRMYFSDGVLKPGQIWIYPPKVPQKYTIYRQDSTVYRYLHFTGSDVQNLLLSLGIEFFTPISTRGDTVAMVLEDIQNSMMDDSVLSALRAEYHTLHLISFLARHSASYRSNMMKRVTDNMNHSFSAPYEAKIYADMFQVSVSRFNHLFKQYVGVAPYAYFVRLRVENACALLEDTDLKIQDIAERCGYEDAFYFTQVFKKNVGLTPSAYRRANRY